MSRGITLLCIGDPNYGYFAANMALSLKSVSPDIPIQLVHEPHSISYLNSDHLRLFDVFTRIDIKDAWLDKFSPAKAKLSLYKYLAFEETIYFDIDGVAIRDVNELFTECEGLDFSTQIQARTHITKEFTEQDLKQAIQWAPLETIREYFPFPSETILPALNTSFMYIRKSDFAAEFFSRALENIHNPIPLQKIKTWGAGQPDELYISITMAQMQYVPDKPVHAPVYLRHRKADKEPVGTLEELKKNHYVIGVYGDAGYNHRSQLDYYDRLIKGYCRDMGLNHDFKIHRLMDYKWVRNKR